MSEVEDIAVTAGQLEQLVAFERDSLAPAGSEISKQWFYELQRKGLVARIQSNTVVTRKGTALLERFRVMCRNLRIVEIR